MQCNVIVVIIVVAIIVVVVVWSLLILAPCSDSQATRTLIFLCQSTAGQVTTAREAVMSTLSMNSRTPTLSCRYDEDDDCGIIHHHRSGCGDNYPGSSWRRNTKRGRMRRRLHDGHPARCSSVAGEHWICQILLCDSIFLPNLPFPSSTHWLTETTRAAALSSVSAAILMTSSPSHLPSTPPKASVESRWGWS